MFSTNDSLATRRLRVVATAPGRAQELAIPPRLEKLAARAAALPDDRRLTRLARAMARAEHEAGRPVETIEIEVRGTDYAPITLFASERSLARLRVVEAGG